MKTKLLLVWTGIFLIGIIPIILLLVFGSKNYSSIPFTLGQICGLVGLTFFALTLLLSTRVKWIEYLFDGLDKVYPVHAIIGALSFILLLMHPVLLVMKYIPQNIALAARYILPGGLISVDFGIFALLCMIILLVITLYGAWRYQQWKFSHEFLGVAFILATLHVLLVRNTVARDYIFNGYNLYVIIVVVIGLTGFIYSLARNKLKGKMYRIKKINVMNECYELILEPEKEGIQFKSGQFVFVKFQNRTVGKESHPFSIASPTGVGKFRIIVKNLGDFTSRIGKLREGNKVIVEGPYGRFHKNDYENETWVAGGIGITPFLGLAKDITDKGKVDLYYTVKNKNEFVFLEELQDIAKSNKNFHIFPWTSDDDGFLNIDSIAKNGTLKNKKYYLCGPVSMKNAIRGSLIKNQISNDDIHDERFAFK